MNSGRINSTSHLCVHFVHLVREYLNIFYKRLKHTVHNDYSIIQTSFSLVPNIFNLTLAQLTFKSLRLTLCTTSFNIQKFCVLPTMHLCVLCGSENKQRLFFYTALTYRFFITEAECLLRGTNCVFNLLKPSGHVIYQQFNIQQLYVLPTLYLRVLYLSENKQRLVPLTA